MSRWSFASVLPIVFVSWIILTSHTVIFGFYYAEFNSLTAPQPTEKTSPYEIAVSALLAILFVLCYSLAMFTDPGAAAVQTSDITPSNASSLMMSQSATETKKNGSARFCKWCHCYKPDRAHHCRMCKTCILKMDHHCPWVSNCIGYRNHKYFHLLVFYATASCIWNLPRMFHLVHVVEEEEMSTFLRFCVILGVVMTSFMTMVLMPFIFFHMWLLVNNTTTIEFCEKSTKGEKYASRYNVGVYGNLCAVLGPNPLLWLVPIPNSPGDGRTFDTTDAMSMTDSLNSEAAKRTSSDLSSGQLEESGMKPEITGGKGALV